MTRARHDDDLGGAGEEFAQRGFVATENSDWATNCPEYKVTAVLVTAHAKKSEWQKGFDDFAGQQESLLPKGALKGDAR